MLKYNGKMGCAVMIGTSIVTSSSVHACCGGVKTVDLNENNVKAAFDENFEQLADDGKKALENELKVFTAAAETDKLKTYDPANLNDLGLKAKSDCKTVCFTINGDGKFEYAKTLDAKNYSKETGILVGTVEGGKKGGKVTFAIKVGEKDDKKDSESTK